MSKESYCRILLAALMLTIGGGLYLLFRPQSLLLFHVATHAGLMGVIGPWREQLSDMNLPQWTVYNLPGALWAGAYVLLTDTLLTGNGWRERLLWTALMPAIGIGSELLQAVGWLPGTPDAADVTAYALPYLLYLLSIYQPRIYKTFCNAFDR